jgi:hypothetical protein
MLLAQEIGRFKTNRAHPNEKMSASHLPQIRNEDKGFGCGALRHQIIDI